MSQLWYQLEGTRTAQQDQVCKNIPSDNNRELLHNSRSHMDAHKQKVVYMGNNNEVAAVGNNEEDSNAECELWTVQNW